MAKMGSRKHLKRFKSPKHWPIPPKESKWTVKPSPGPHGMENSLPLLIIVRDILGVADTSREAKKIINSGEILIDGQPRKNYKFPVGFMDVVEIPRTGKTYRVGLSEKGELTLYPIEEEDKGFKLCKIVKKTTLKGGKTQLNFHDGRNHITNEKFKVGDVIKLKIPQQDIIDSISFKEGNIGLVTGGKHIGEIGQIKKITITRSSMPNTVIIETEDNKNFMTLKDYVFVIGEKEPAIQIGGKP